MKTGQTPGGAFHPAIAFWSQIAQMQVEQTIRLCAFWARFLPQPSASQLSAEAEALKPVVRTAASRTAARPAPRPEARPQPVPQPASQSATPRTEPQKVTPLKQTPRTPAGARKKPVSLTAAKTALH